MRVRRYRIREGSGGAGSAKGGDGIERDLEMLEDVTVSLIPSEGTANPGAWPAAPPAPGVRTGSSQEATWTEPNPSPTSAPCASAPATS
jgi:N-methylhydantoinase B/oxoprolinase/acetone carboxylase alpha subunit